ncbi:hypothetical protein QEH54_22155 [Pelagicoccus sp. SDUM812003]|nr:hypothetical protein [Pelagicoccus sp. SDUM812003]
MLPFSILALFFLIGCSEEAPKPADLYFDRSNVVLEAYFSGSPEEAKSALKADLELIEEFDRDDENDIFTEEGGAYYRALNYTRLAMITESEGRKEISDEYYSQALQYWAQFLKLNEQEQNKNPTKTYAQYMVDSLDHGGEGKIRWRQELDRQPLYYYPKHQINEEGLVEPGSPYNSGQSLRD